MSFGTLQGRRDRLPAQQGGGRIKLGEGVHGDDARLAVQRITGNRGCGRGGGVRCGGLLGCLGGPGAHSDDGFALGEVAGEPAAWYTMPDPTPGGPGYTLTPCAIPWPPNSNGVDIVTVADIMGHARIDTVRLYTRSSEADRARAIEKILITRRIARSRSQPQLTPNSRSISVDFRRVLRRPPGGPSQKRISRAGCRGTPRLGNSRGAPPLG
jgi:hypothetical protein